MQKDPPHSTTTSACSILDREKDPKKTCDETRNDTISVLASSIKRQGVSSMVDIGLGSLAMNRESAHTIETFRIYAL